MSSTPSSESPTLLDGWPTSSRPSKSESTKQPLSALPRIPKKKENGYGSRMNSRGKHRNRRDEVLRRLDVDDEQLAAQPRIAPLLRMNGIHDERFVEVLRCDANPMSITFVQQWDKLTPASRHIAGLEAIAVSVGILPHQLWGLFAGAALLQANQSAAVLVAMSLPDVIKMTIKGAKKAKGLADREHLLKAARVLPTPKGSVTNINLPGAKEVEELEESNKGDLEPADGFVLNAAKCMNPPKALPAARALDEVEEAIADDGDFANGYTGRADGR
jgi:hypothetical protein